MSSRPNILLLISHDLGTHVGPYGFESDATPVLNGLAAEGLTLDRHFVTSPGCSQSRSSLVTGRYPHANGQFGLSHLGWTVNRDEELLPAVLRSNGYRTAMFGIWHLAEWTLGGFDQVSDDVSVVDSSPEGFAEVAADRATDWLQENAGQETPFYLHVGFWEAHRPFCGQPGDPGKLPEPDLNRIEVPEYLPDNESTRREFFHLQHSVRAIDDGVGKVLAALTDTGQAENTLVIFTADHGLPFPRAKGTLYDPGVQVAFVARLPGRIAAGSRSDALTSNVDVMPTLLDLAGVTPGARLQGESLANLLQGETDSATGRPTVFSEKTYHEHYDPIRSIRGERFKYIRNFAERPALVMPSDIYNSPTRQSMTADEELWAARPAEEFYDLLADPGERLNLKDHPELPAMRTALLDWMKKTGDPLLDGPIPRPPFKAS
jgi:N-sulfoglucosamine sulfohydrolase